MSPDIFLGKPQQAEIINAEGPPRISRLHVGQLVVPEGTLLSYKGRPHEIAMAAIQGFPEARGSVSTHTEPISPGVTEMYFALSGLVLAHVDLPGRRRHLGTHTLRGEFHHTVVDGASFNLVQDPMFGFLLEMAAPDASDITRVVKPALVILPGKRHGTMALVANHGVEPRFFAMKLREHHVTATT